MSFPQRMIKSAQKRGRLFQGFKKEQVAANAGGGEWVAIDGSKFRAVGCTQSVRERDALKRHLKQLEQTNGAD